MSFRISLTNGVQATVLHIPGPGKTGEICHYLQTQYVKDNGEKLTSIIEKLIEKISERTPHVFCSFTVETCPGWRGGRFSGGRVLRNTCLIQTDIRGQHVIRFLGEETDMTAIIKKIKASGVKRFYLNKQFNLLNNVDDENKLKINVNLTDLTKFKIFIAAMTIFSIIGITISLPPVSLLATLAGKVVLVTSSLGVILSICFIVFCILAERVWHSPFISRKGKALEFEDMEIINQNFFMNQLIQNSEVKCFYIKSSPYDSNAMVYIKNGTKTHIEYYEGLFECQTVKMVTKLKKTLERDGFQEIFDLQKHWDLPGIRSIIY